ncbi:hypothetical protein H5410_064754 [Solanum commersonii]|uniref:Uncharacterized protein n=1 Tax=Solanum commersonii TaxID=4109 RepID=A0A9J5VYM2_SOLCO|nr:hypothetical protein H5410_064754 [Solanum commersonii]
MASASHTDDTCLAGEGQDLEDEEEDLETILKRCRSNPLDYPLDYPCGGRTRADPDSRDFHTLLPGRDYVIKEPWTFSNYSRYSSTQFSFMNIIKRRSIVKNSRKEEYDIPQHLDLLNKWTIPKISPRIIYQMDTFEKLGLKQVVKTTEETITIDSDNQTFRSLSDNNLKV